MHPSRHTSLCIVHYALCIALAALCAASADAGWLYDGSGSTKTLTELDPPDGGTPWILKCAVSGGTLTLTGVQQAGDGAIINLRLPVADANDTPYNIVAIGDNAFKEVGTIEEVRLPDTLATIGAGAFNNCPLLMKVTPFLPDSVSSVGYNAFRATPVAGSLRVGFGGPFAFAMGPYATQFQQFYGSGIEEFVAGPGLTAIPQEVFSGCTSLTNVDLSATTALTLVGLGAFNGCTALRRVTPLLPDTVTELGVVAFNNAPVEGSLRLGFGPSFTMLNDSRGWNQGHYFANTKITEAVFGPEVTNIKVDFAAGCTELTNVVFQAPDLASVGREAFDGCTALRRVTPLLPESVTYLGTMAFRNTAVEGSVRLGFGGPLSLPADFYGQAQTFSNARVDEFIFGPDTTTVPDYFAPNCKLLTNVVFQTTNLTSIGRDAFSGCSTLSRVTPLLPDTVAYVGTMAFYNTAVEGSVRLGFGGAVSLPADYYNQAQTFGGTRISEVICGSGVTVVPAYFAYRCTLLTNLVFSGTNAVAIGANAFDGCSALRDITAYSLATCGGNSFLSTGQNLHGRLMYPKTSRGWSDYIASLGSGFKSWAEDATASEKDLYETLFPEGDTPRGYAAFGGPTRWFVPYSDAVAGAVNVTVIGEPFDLGSASPAYTDQTTVNPPEAFSVSQYGETGGIAYESVGYRIDAMGEETWIAGNPVLNSRAFSFSPEGGDVYRVAWLWRETAYAISVHGADNGLCSVSVSGTTVDDPSISGTYYVSNTIVTVAATPAAGVTFGRWFGDVPEGQETQTTISLTMDAVKSLSPYMEMPWTYDADSKTVTDGYWTLNVTGSSDALKIASVKTAPDNIWLLDLRKATDGCVFASIGTDAFKQKTYLQEVRLPDTITAVGRGAFDGCTALTRVTPLLPDAVTQVGVEAFRNAPVEGTLRVGFGGPFTLLADDRGWNGSEYFTNTKVGEIVFGPGVTNIRNNFALNSTALTNVVFQTTNLTTVGYGAFDGCTALRRVTPLLPDTVTYLGTMAFRNTAVEGSVRLGFGGPLSLPADFYGQAQTFSNARVGAFIFGPGTTTIPAYFAPNCTLLANVVFQTTNLTSIGRDAFNGCTSLRLVNPFLPDTLTYLGALAFSGAPVEGMLRLGFGKPLLLGSEFYNQSRAFWGAHIDKLVAGRGVTNIPPYMASNCGQLTSIDLDCRNLAQIAEGAFQSDSAVAAVRLRAFPSFAANVFNGVPANARFFLARECEEWDGWLANPANATPWDALAASAKEAYYADWGTDARRPTARTVSSGAPFPKNSWLVRYTADGATMVIMR